VRQEKMRKIVTQIKRGRREKVFFCLHLFFLRVFENVKKKGRNERETER
jgi:hypothetical protein